MRARSLLFAAAVSLCPGAALADPAPAKPTSDMRKLGDAFVEIAERVSPSVVQLDVTTSDGGVQFRWMRAEGERHVLGSGVVFSSDGAVLTNNHVIESARTITVRLRDGRMFPGRVAGRDPSTDLAVVKVDAKNLPAANFGDSDAAKVGEWVLAIGSPFGFGHTVTTGVLSAKGRGGLGVNEVEDYLQTDATINSGNSGGPLIDLDGKVLGINTMLIANRGAGIGLAVPSSIAKRVAEQILKTGRVDRPTVGMTMQDLTPQLAAELKSAPEAGALVTSVMENGPSARAHLAPGDVVLSFAGKPVRGAQDLIGEIFAHAPGESLPIDFVRAGKRQRTLLVLESRHDPAPPALPIDSAPTRGPGLGLSVRDFTTMDGAKVAVIANVAPDSPADRAGVKPGDLILEVDGKGPPTAAEVRTATDRGHALVRVRRDGVIFYAALR